MAVNYNDERFEQVESAKNQALNNINNTYNNMINQSDQYYQAQIDAAKEYGQTQQELQQQQTDFAIEQVNQQKEQAEKDYKKEQSGAYVDWQKQSNAYGANAEQMAASGLAGTGYSESSQVSMYNTYQNRVATARESYNKAILNYDNAIKDAILQNNAKLAEIAYQALQTQLELSLEGFQYKNSLVLEQVNAQQTIDNEYYDRWLNVLNQINTENALAEEKRQFEAQMAEEKRQFDLQLAEEKRQYNESLKASKSSGSGGGAVIKSSGGGSSAKSYVTAVGYMAQRMYTAYKALYKDSAKAETLTRKYLDQQVAQGTITGSELQAIANKYF